MKKALIAMSGGVDSSVCAAIIKDMGFECIGATMRLRCTSETDIADAKSVCDRLGIEHITFDMSDGFERNVIDKFVRAYEDGITPNPCIDCNRYMKFGALLKKADELGCSHIVTGHYARIENTPDGYRLMTGLDITKDQSYVLYTLRRDDLPRVMFPLGNLTKAKTRELAKQYGFEKSDKKESQDICFVPDGKYADFIERYTGKTYPDGKFVDTNGNTLGTHRGIIRYTIGQRRGLGLALPAPLYVKQKDLKTNTVTLAPENELYTNSLVANEFNFLTYEVPPNTFNACVKTRYNSRPAPATVTVIDKTTVRVVFDTPQRAITSGQAAVIYDGETVVGGGTIV